MTATREGKKKGPPAFHYLPKSRAKRLRRSWVEDHKIRSKWRAQKKREGVANQATIPIEDAPNHRPGEVDAEAELDTSPNPNRWDKSPTPVSPSPPRDKQSLRDLRRIAYTPKPLHTHHADSSPLRKVTGRLRTNHTGKTTVGRETRQPNMKLRMGVLLEKIKRDFS